MCVSAEWCAHSSETEVHTGGNGSSADGEKPVQGETDGAAGGRPVDRNDPVNISALFSLPHFFPDGSVHVNYRFTKDFVIFYFNEVFLLYLV